MSYFKRVAHDSHIPCAVKGKVDAPFLSLSEPIASWTCHWIVAVCGTKLFGDFELAFIDIEAIDASGSTVLGRLQDGQTDCTQAPNRYRYTVAEVRVVHDGSPTSGDTTAEQAHFSWISCWVDLSQRDVTKNSVLTERRAAHKVVDYLAIHS